MPLNRAPQRPPVLNSASSGSSSSSPSSSFSGQDTGSSGGGGSYLPDMGASDHVAASSGEDAPSSSSNRTLASLRTRENIYLLALILLLTLGYIVHQTIQRKNSERKAFKRKARLLGINPSASSLSSPSTGPGPTPVSSTSGVTAANGAGDASVASSLSSMLTRQTRALARQLHLDACLVYISDLSTSTLKHFVKSKGTERRRRKSTSNANASETSPSSAVDGAPTKVANGSAATPGGKDARNRAGTTTSFPSQSKTHSSNEKHSNSTHGSAGPQAKSPGRPNGPSRHSLNNAPSSSSRSRSATQSAKQQQQQQSRHASLSPNPAAAVASSHETKPVMKSIGIQVGGGDLAGPTSTHESDQHDIANVHPGRRKAKTRDNKIPGAQAAPSANSASSSNKDNEDDVDRTDFEIARETPLPAEADDSQGGQPPDLRIKETPTGMVESGLKRSGTITNRKSYNNVSKSLSPMHNSSSIGAAENTTSNSGATSAPANAEASLQSPTCSSSGRSTSLSVSTDETGLTSLHGDSELETVHENVNGHAIASNDPKTHKLHPAVDLKETSTGQTPKKQIPTGLQYSFHTGFQEPTTSELEDGENALESATSSSSPISQPHVQQKDLHTRRQLFPPSSLSEASHILQHPDGSMYLPSPPDSQRKTRVDALGYPSIPLPRSTSSTNSSANNSPSAARRAVPTSRSPSATGMRGLQSPVQERRPSNAGLNVGLNGQSQLDSGKYPASLGLQSIDGFPSLPLSPPSRMNGSQYNQQQQQEQASPHHSNHVAQSGVFPGSPPLAIPPQPLKQAQIQQYVTQAQYQYQQSLQPQSQQSTLGANLHPSLQAHLPQQQQQALQSPSILSPSTSTSAPSPGLLNPLQAHLHASASPSGSTGGGGGGGSGRSSVHQSHLSASSRSTSPHPSNQSTASYSTEPSSVSNAETTPSRLHPARSVSLCSPSLQQQQQSAQYMQQLQQQLYMHTPAHHTQSPQHLDLVQKMLLMQAQIQYAMQQNEAQKQQAQAQAQAQQQFFQSAAANRPASTSVPQTPLTAAGPGIPSPLLYHPDAQQGQVPFVISALNSSPSASPSYATYPGTNVRVR